MTTPEWAKEAVAALDAAPICRHGEAALIVVCEDCTAAALVKVKDEGLEEAGRWARAIHDDAGAGSDNGHSYKTFDMCGTRACSGFRALKSGAGEEGK